MSDLDSAIKSVWVEEPGTGRVEHHVFQPGRRSILEQVEKIRTEKVAQSFNWGRVELEIPELDYWMLVRKNPELISADGETKTRAWKKFIANPDNRKYRVRGTGRYDNRSWGGVTWPENPAGGG